MKEQREKILITGSQGTIGKILAPALARSFEVYRLDRIEEPREKGYRADISNFDELYSAFKAIGNLKYVIHLAASSDLHADWDSILQNNIIGTRNVYECAKRHRVKKVIFASTNQVTLAYEFSRFFRWWSFLHKIHVDDPVRPESDYATSKIFGEAVARQYYERYGIESICLRIGTVVEDNDPTKNKRRMKTWLSPNDLVQLVEKALTSKAKFGIYYGVSNNNGRFWNIENAGEELDYHPQDNSALWQKKHFLTDRITHQ